MCNVKLICRGEMWLSDRARFTGHLTWFLPFFFYCSVKQIPFCRHNSLLSFSSMQKHNKFFQLVCDNLCFVCSPLHFPSCALIAITTFNIHNKIAGSLPQFNEIFLIHKNEYFLSLHLYYSTFLTHEIILIASNDDAATTTEGISLSLTFWCLNKNFSLLILGGGIEWIMQV